MARFDYEISYRRTAAAPTFYSEPYMNGMFDTKVRLFDPPVPFDKKVDAVAYMNSNCGTSSGRAEALRMLIELNQYPVHSYGDCDRNKYTDEDKVGHSDVTFLTSAEVVGGDVVLQVQVLCCHGYVLDWVWVLAERDAD